jgi:O-acetyl-ADP-ribose deacetylase (regulator of RNase III)
VEALYGDGCAMTATCFVIMPYGKKKDIDGREVDFDRVYDELIKGAVDRLDGLKCHRCDDLEKPGWIHEHMVRHILEDPVAIVDTSTLNANVFYELGVRHALRKAVTVLIHKSGTTWPFNIAGLNSIEYKITPAGLEQARKKIRKFISNGLDDAANVDSLVHHAVPGLRVERGAARTPKRIGKVEVFAFRLASRPDVTIALVTGNREAIKCADIWVNSENTEMQMDRFYGESTSATIRYLGAARHPVTGRVLEDTIGDALARAMGSEKQVAPATVIPTEAGALSSSNVKAIFHVASVVGEPREGYRSIDRIEHCVTNSLALMDSASLRGQGLTSILFPILGTGPAGGDLKDHAARLFTAAVEYLEGTPDTIVRAVYFYVWSDMALEVCRQVVNSLPGVEKPAGR